MVWQTACARVKIRGMNSRLGLRNMSGLRGPRWRCVKVPADSSAEGAFAHSHSSSSLGLGTLGPALCAFSLYPSCRLSLAHHTFRHLARAASSGKGKKNHKAHAKAGERTGRNEASPPPAAWLSPSPGFSVSFIQHIFECLLCVRHCAGPWGRDCSTRPRARLP